MQGIAIIVLTLIFTLAIIGLVGAFPIYSLVKCATNQNLPGSKKTFWVIAIVLFSPIAAPAYAMIHPAGTKHLWFGRIYLFAEFVFIFFMIFAVGYLKEESYKQFQSAQTAQLEYDPILQPDQIEKFKTSLQTLGTETQATPKYNVSGIQVVSSFAEILEVIMEDKKVSMNEYTEWTKNFDDRKNLNENQLKMVKWKLRSENAKQQ